MLPIVVKMLCLSIGLSIAFFILFIKFPEYISYFLMIGNVSISVMILVIALIEKSYLIILLGFIIYLCLLGLWENNKDTKIAMKLIKITCSLLKEQSDVYFIAITCILINIIFSIF